MTKDLKKVVFVCASIIIGALALKGLVDFTKDLYRDAHQSVVIETVPVTNLRVDGSHGDDQAFATVRTSAGDGYMYLPKTMGVGTKIMVQYIDHNGRIYPVLIDVIKLVPGPQEVVASRKQ